MNGNDSEFQVISSAGTEDACIEAQTSGPRDVALREAMHYAAQYAEDGPVSVVEQVEVARLGYPSGNYGPTATPPADAALIGKLRHQLAQVTEECAALRALAVPEGFVLVPAGIKSVDRDFEYDASEEMHIPKIVVRFAPGKATDAQTWDGRDKLAWSITQASRALLAASKSGQ